MDAYDESDQLLRERMFGTSPFSSLLRHMLIHDNQHDTNNLDDYESRQRSLFFAAVEALLLSRVLRESLNQENQISTTNGLSDSMISKSLRTRDCNKDDEENICVVCQDGLAQEVEKIATLDCNHEYHHDCIKTWLLHKNFCPICKATAVNVN